MPRPFFFLLKLITNDVLVPWKKKTLLINLIKHNIIKYQENNTSCDTFSISDMEEYISVLC